MDDKTMERYGALGAIWFIVFGLIGGLLAGAPPSRTDSASEIAAYFADNDSAIQTGALLTVVGVLGLVWFFGSLWAAMARADGGAHRSSVIALIGFVVSGAMASASFAINAGTAAAIDSLGEGSAVFFEIASIFVAWASVGDVIMVSAVCAIIWRTEFLPKWVAQAGVAVIVTSALAAIGIASDSNFFGVMALVAFIVWAAWLVTVGVLLYRDNDAA